jgi:hypothetical protein
VKARASVVLKSGSAGEVEATIMDSFHYDAKGKPNREPTFLHMDGERRSQEALMFSKELVSERSKERGIAFPLHVYGACAPNT